MGRGISELQKRILEMAFETYYGDPLVPAADDYSAPRLSDQEMSRYWAAKFGGGPVDESIVMPHWGVAHVQSAWVVAEMLGVEHDCHNFWTGAFRHDDKHTEYRRRRWARGVDVPWADYNKAAAVTSRSLKRLRVRGLLGETTDPHGDYLTTKGLAKCIELFGTEPPARAWTVNQGASADAEYA